MELGRTDTDLEPRAAGQETRACRFKRGLRRLLVRLQVRLESSMFTTHRIYIGRKVGAQLSLRAHVRILGWDSTSGTCN